MKRPEWEGYRRNIGALKNGYNKAFYIKTLAKPYNYDSTYIFLVAFLFLSPGPEQVSNECNARPKSLCAEIISSKEYCKVK